MVTKKKLLETLIVLNEKAIGLILKTTINNDCLYTSHSLQWYRVSTCLLQMLQQTDPRRYCEAPPTWPWWKTWLVAGMRIRSASRGRGSRKHPGRP